MNHLRQVTIDLIGTPASGRFNGHIEKDKKDQANAGRGGFSRPVWPFLVAAKREQETPQIPGNPDLAGFSS